MSQEHKIFENSSRGESIPMLDRVQSAAQMPTFMPLKMGNVLDQIHPDILRNDLYINAGFQFVAGYDNFTPSSSLAAFGVKCLYGSQAVPTEQLAGHPVAILFILGCRVAGAVFNVINQNMAEQERQTAELKRLNKLIDRHRAIQRLQEKLPVCGQSQSHGKRDVWSEVNFYQFKQYMDSYPASWSLSEYEAHKLYFSIRMAAHKENKQTVYKSLRSFLKEKTQEAKNKFALAMEIALKKKIKSVSIADKDTRFVGRVLKFIGNFILANSTGMSIVIVITGFLAVAGIPGLTMLMSTVYAAAIAFGLTFAFLKLAYEKKERRHHKIKNKLAKEKTRHKQHQVIQILSRPFVKFQASILESLSDGDHEYPETLLQDDSRDTLSFIKEVDFRSFLKTFFLNLPLTLSIGVVSGWWGVFTVVGVGAWLFGGAGLIGISALIWPAVGAVAVGLYAVARSAVDWYFAHKIEQEKVIEINDNLSLQKRQARVSVTLRAVNRLSRAELLAAYIEGVIASEEDKKRQFHRIEKVLGVKKSNAKDEGIFYGYLLSQLIGDNDSVSDDKTDNARSIVEKLRSYMNDGADEKVIQSAITPIKTFLSKPKTSVEKFRAMVSFAFSATTPIVIGLALASAFVSGAAFTFVGIGMAIVFCIICTINATMNDRRETRMKHYESRLAHIEMRDVVADFALRASPAFVLNDGSVPYPDAFVPLAQPEPVLEEVRAGSPTGSVVEPGSPVTPGSPSIRTPRGNQCFFNALPYASVKHAEPVKVFASKSVLFHNADTSSLIAKADGLVSLVAVQAA